MSQRERVRERGLERERERERERAAHLEHHAGLLQQVGPHVGADDAVARVEADLDVLAEATAVVVPGRLGVSYGLGDSMGERRLPRETGWERAGNQGRPHPKYRPARSDDISVFRQPV